MTGVQKILARAAGKAHVSAGMTVVLPEKAVGIDSDDAACGAYGSLFLPKSDSTAERKIRVPNGIFLDLGGVLRNDVTSAEVADFLFSLCLPYLVTRQSPKIAPEFGGDSLTYLTMADRLATAERFVLSGCGFAPLFECDFVAAQYVAERGFAPIRAVFNDSPDDFAAVVTADLGKI